MTTQSSVRQPLLVNRWNVWNCKHDQQCKQQHQLLFPLAYSTSLLRTWIQDHPPSWFQVRIKRPPSPSKSSIWHINSRAHSSIGSSIGGGTRTWVPPVWCVGSRCTISVEQHNVVKCIGNATMWMHRRCLGQSLGLLSIGIAVVSGFVVAPEHNKSCDGASVDYLDKALLRLRTERFQAS